MNTTELKKLQAEITQGKWNKFPLSKERRDSNGYVIQSLQNETVVCCVEELDTKEMTAANGRAIALVPQLIAQNIELREALKEVVNQLTTLRSEYYRQGVTLTNEQVNMGSAALLQAKAALGEK